MKIDVKISSFPASGNVKAYASVNFDDVFAITGLKVMEGRNGLFVSMPSRRLESGEYRDVCFPITGEFRQQLTDAVIGEYHQAMQQFRTQTAAYSQQTGEPENFYQAEQASAIRMTM